jgi:hypothetical protein
MDDFAHFISERIAKCRLLIFHNVRKKPRNCYRKFYTKIILCNITIQLAYCGL